jgi:beta-glucosidase
VFIFNILDGVGQVNQAGIDHYNKLINALLAKGERVELQTFLNT